MAQSTTQHPHVIHLTQKVWRQQDCHFSVNMASYSVDSYYSAFLNLSKKICITTKNMLQYFNLGDLNQTSNYFWGITRSFFSSSFEPASYSLVGRLILNPNQPMILFDLLGLQRNLSKFEMNLPEIYLFSSPLLCLCVNFFCFVLFWKYQQIFRSLFELRHTCFIKIFFICYCFEYQRSIDYARRALI